MTLDHPEASQEPLSGVGPSTGSPRPISKTEESQISPDSPESPLSDPKSPQNEIYNDQTRHGFEDAYDHYSEHMKHFYLYYAGKKYADNFRAIPESEKRLKGNYFEFPQDWKVQRPKAHAIQGGVFICLNAAVEPPDGRKGKPCATMEGWIDPHSFGGDSHGAAAAVAENVVKQYRSFTMKNSFKAYPDTVGEDMKKAILSWRRAAKESGTPTRYVFHYNGHGVPEPTTLGEFWVFNRQYTQYIPQLMNDLQTWLGAPSILVYDCNKAGNLVNSFKACVQARIDAYYEMQARMNTEYDGLRLTNGYVPTNPKSFLDCFQFAACAADEYLPLLPELPADLFTCCMTTPIEILVKFYLLRNPHLAPHFKGLFDKDLAHANVADFKMKYHRPLDFDTSHFKRTSEKKDQIADLGYIFNLVADTIAYTCIPRALFRRCFRLDLVCCSFFRNFLLAQRIMTYYGCTPISDPPLPDCRNCELWDHWDTAVEHFLTLLVRLKALHPEHSLTLALAESPRYIFTNFFDAALDHMKSWIQHGRYTMVPPPQVAMTLQLLLIPKYRARALKLLALFVDLGPWAVGLVLNLGVFPYVIKLLQLPVLQLKPMLTFVWAKLLACDYPNMQHELLVTNANAFRYFYFMLVPEAEKLNDTQLRHRNAYFDSIDKQEKQQRKLEAKIGKPTATVFKTLDLDPTPDLEARPNKLIDFDDSVGLSFHHLTVLLVVLTLLIRDFPAGRDKLVDRELHVRVMDIVERAKATHTNLQLWGALFFAECWKSLAYAKQICVENGFLARLARVYHDKDSILDVRAAIVNAFTAFLTPPDQKLTAELEEIETRLAEEVASNLYDASVAVRKEMAVFISAFINKHLPLFRVIALTALEEEIVTMEAHGDLFDFRKKFVAYGTVYSAVWKALQLLSLDPHDEVQNLAEQVVAAVLALAKSCSELKEPFDFLYRYLLKKLGEGAVALPYRQGRRAISHLSRRGSGESLGLSLLHKTASFSSLVKNFTGISQDEVETTQVGGSSTELREKLTHPLPARFDYVDLTKTRPVLPLRSGLLDFCKEYYQYPQLTPWPDLDPVIDEHDHKFTLWRKLRNDATIASAQRDKHLAIEGDWSRPAARLATGFLARVYEFTQFEQLLVASDGKDAVGVWNYAKQQRMCAFLNGNHASTRILQLQFMNEDDTPILVVGLTDGTVKLYKHFEDLDRCNMISAWQTLSNVTGINDGTNFLFEWQQARGDLIATGNVKVFNIWNAYKEKFVRVIPKRSVFPVSSLTCDQLDGNIFAAGFGNGDIRVYDKRCRPKEEVVQEWGGKDSSVTRTGINNIHMQRGGFRELVSASNNGLVQLWDIRLKQPVESVKTGPSLKAMRVHEHAPVFATAADSVKLWSTRGVGLCEFYNDSRNPEFKKLFPNVGRHGGVLGMAMHPHRMVLAVSNGGDDYVNIYQATKR